MVLFLSYKGFFFEKLPNESTKNYGFGTARGLDSGTGGVPVETSKQVVGWVLEFFCFCF